MYLDFVMINEANPNHVEEKFSCLRLTGDMITMSLMTENLHQLIKTKHKYLFQKHVACI